MNPGENFGFINSFLRNIGPVIRNNNGFIDKYIGDAIMALFPGFPDNAVQAAMDMQKNISIYNKHNSYLPPISIGVGVHYGKLMLGIIGESKRMESTVISDAVNLASRIESLTKRYKAKILVSEDTICSLTKKSDLNFRKIDIVRVKGKKMGISLYEILDEEIDSLTRKKIASSALFEKGIEFFQKGDLYRSRKNFVEILKINAEDHPAKLFLERINFHIKSGIGIGWDGILEMDTK